MVTAAPRPATLRQAGLFPMVFPGLVRLLGRQGRDRSRYQLLKSVWTELKRYGAPHVQNVALAELGLHDVSVDGSPNRLGPLVVAALARRFACRRIFEFGTYLGHTSWLIAHNNPDATVVTLDIEPAELSRLALEVTDIECFGVATRGDRISGTPEADRIQQLYGDSATFDYAPYAESMDLVFIDASHSYSYVRSDTEAALSMLRPGGTIIWDDYPQYPGVYRYLNELAPTLDQPLYHVLGTQLVVYTGQRLLLDELEVPEPA